MERMLTADMEFPTQSILALVGQVSDGVEPQNLWERVCAADQVPTKEKFLEALCTLREQGIMFYFSFVIKISTLIPISINLGIVSIWLMVKLSIFLISINLNCSPCNPNKSGHPLE